MNGKPILVKIDEFDDVIVEWHKLTFPEATKKEQIDKLLKEITEFEEAGNDEDRAREFADVKICFVALCGRFELNGFDISKEDIARLDKCYCFEPNIYRNTKLRHAYINKIATVMKRRFKKNEQGEYRHISD